MTITELRKQHALTHHHDGGCCCSLWYVPTYSAVRAAWRARQRKRRHAAEKFNAQGSANPRQGVRSDTTRTAGDGS